MLGSMRTFLIALLVTLTAPALAADPQIAITIKDHQYVPSDVPVPAGVKVELVIKNDQLTSAGAATTQVR